MSSLDISPLWIVDGKTTTPRCQGSSREKSSLKVFDQIDKAEKSLDGYSSLPNESKIKIQATIETLNEEIQKEDGLFLYRKLSELNEKNKWSCIASSLGYLEEIAQNDERTSLFLKIYEKLSSFFNRLDPSTLQPDQRVLVDRFQDICNQQVEVKKKKEESRWSDIAEDLNFLAGDFSSCEESEKNKALLVYGKLDDFFNQLDLSTLSSFQHLWQRFNGLSQENSNLITTYYQTVRLTHEALNEFTSFEIYFNDVQLDPLLSEDKFNIIAFDYNVVLKKLQKQVFFICPEVWANVNDRLDLIQKRLEAFKANRSPKSVADL